MSTRFHFRPYTFALIVYTALALPAAGAPADPEAHGPYPVGVTTVQLADESRHDADLDMPRPLLTEIWYPAAASAEDAEPTRFSEFYLDGENATMNAILSGAFKFDITTMDERFETYAVRDAAMAGGTFPLLVFSHGNGGMRAQSTFWCDHMASHGYIVAATDHTHNAAATAFEGRIIPFKPDGRQQARIDRPKDVSFLIDALDRLNRDSESQFHNHVDLERIGVAGHSFGGYTAMAAAARDPRVDAIAPMAAVVPDFTRKSTVPLLLFIATEDDTINAEGNAEARAYYEATTAPKYRVELKDGGHYTFSDMYQINPAWGDGIGKGERITDGSPLTYIGQEKAYALTNGYSTAFFARHLKEQDAFAGYLDQNQDEAAVLYDANPAGTPPE